MKGSISDEAIFFMESSLNKNFQDNKVKMSDRVYQIMKPIGMEEDKEIEVNLKKCLTNKLNNNNFCAPETKN